MRFLRPETTIFWFAFFLKGLGYEYLSKSDPDLNTINDSMQPQNYVLLFFLSSFVFLLIGIVQYILSMINSWVFSNKYLEFMDLCSVSNISMIIMDTYLHGYYVHGEAPWVSSDIVMSQLKKNLDNEGKGVGIKRGITDRYRNH